MRHNQPINKPTDKPSIQSPDKFGGIAHSSFGGGGGHHGGGGGGHWGGRGTWGGGWGGYLGYPYYYDPYWGREELLYVPTDTSTVTLTDDEKKALKEELKKKKKAKTKTSSAEGDADSTSTPAVKPPAPKVNAPDNGVSVGLKRAGIVMITGFAGMGIAYKMKKNTTVGTVIGLVIGVAGGILFVKK